MFFDRVEGRSPDIMNRLKQEVDSDTSPHKVDLGVGVYRNEEGHIHELDSITRAKAYLETTNPSHDVASVQSLGGTGAIFIGLSFLRDCVPGTRSARVYLGTPTWPNYKPLAERLGFSTLDYRFYDTDKRDIDMSSQLEAISSAPQGSIFIFQGCCHNPTAMEFNEEQWQQIADAMTAKHHLALFDIAYQGLGKGLVEDNYGIHHFVDRGIEILVCQSSSKNFGLYGERLGALHVVCSDAKIAANVKDQLRTLVRTEYSCSPLFGARLVDHIMADDERVVKWRAELAQIRARLQKTRQEFRDLLEVKYKTPGDWSFITRGSGLFSLFPLSLEQCLALKDKYRIYVVVNGRLAISGLTKDNIDYVVKSVDSVVRHGP